MVTKKSGDEKKNRVKIEKLNINKETVSELTDEEKKNLKGGIVIANVSHQSCPGDTQAPCGCRTR